MRLVSSNTVMVWCVAVYVVSANPEQGETRAPVDVNGTDAEQNVPFMQRRCPKCGKLLGKAVYNRHVNYCNPSAVANKPSPPLYMEPQELGTVPKGGRTFVALRKIDQATKESIWTTDRPSNLGTIARERGFTVSHNKGAGDCMFIALSEQLRLVTGRRISHKDLRRLVVQYLKENPETRDGTHLFNFVAGYPSWGAYLTDMMDDHTWGDHVILNGAANCFKICVHVISSLGRDHDQMICEEFDDAGSNRLVLGYVDQLHYVSLLPHKGGQGQARAPVDPNGTDPEQNVSFLQGRCPKCGRLFGEVVFNRHVIYCNPSAVANEPIPPSYMQPQDLDTVPKDSEGTDKRLEGPTLKVPSQPSTNECFDCIPQEQILTDRLLKREILEQMFKKIWEILRCPISLDLVQSPITLECGHSLSKRKLQRLLRERGNETSCPICRQLYGLTTEVVMLRDIVDVLREYNPFNEEFEEEQDGDYEEREGDSERLNVPVMEEREGDGERLNVPVMEEHAATGGRVYELLELPGDDELPEGALC